MNARLTGLTESSLDLRVATKKGDVVVFSASTSLAVAEGRYFPFQMVGLISCTRFSQKRVAVDALDDTRMIYFSIIKQTAR